MAQNPLRGHPGASGLARDLVDLIARMIDDRLRPFTTGDRLDLSKRDGIIGFVPIGNGGTGGGSYQPGHQIESQGGAPLTQRPVLNFTGPGVTAADNAAAGRTDVSIAAGGMANPMTTAGDLIVGGAGGAPTRLAEGPAYKTLVTTPQGTIAWATPATPASALVGSTPEIIFTNDGRVVMVTFTS